MAWARTKTGWWWRLAIVIWFGVMLVQNWHDPQFALARLSNPFSALDMGIHELGHALFSVFGEFMHIAGGSLFQCIFPLLWLGAFLQKRYYFASALCLSWLGLNLFDVAAYAADAQSRLLPLAGGLASIGAEDTEATYDAGHDWYQLLSRTGHLQNDNAIADSLRTAGSIIYIVGLIFATLLVVIMITTVIRRHREQVAKDA
ncbi:MAG TPA: hypothetical protein VLF43_03895 [Candidatus Saccharimonadales bacterium]|nr:hypothetical protein [Candidatus Saccharimonadales bacterium]